MNARLCLLAVFAVALGCAAPQRADPSTEAVQGKKPAISSADAKRQLLAALERELDPLATRKVSGPQDRFKGAVEGLGEVRIEDEESFTLVDIPIGTESPIKCFVYKEEIDVGQSLRSLIQAFTGDFEIDSMRPTEIGAAGSRPALFMEINYSSDAGEGVRAAGQAKLLASADDNLPLICIHDEVGYRRTFRRITHAFAASIEPTGNAPRFSELQVYKVNELPVGYEHRRVWDAEKAQAIVATSSVLLMPKSKKEFAFQDTVTTVVSDAKGRISQHNYAKAINGEVVIQAIMERQKGNTYSVQGTRDGKDFQATLQTKDKAGLPSDLLIHKEIKEALLRGKKPTLTFETYQPASETTALREITYKKTEASARSVSVEMDGTTLEGEVDEHGTVERLDMPLSSGAKMRMDRVLAQGTP